MSCHNLSTTAPHSTHPGVVRAESNQQMAEHIVVGGLDAWLTFGASAHTAPKVFVVLIHGRTQSHRDSDLLANQICAALPQVVCATFDLPNHGDRVRDASLNEKVTPANSERILTMMMAMLDQGAADAESLLRYMPLVRPELANCHRIAIGVSLGGSIVWKLVAELSNHESLLDGAIPLLSTPDLASLVDGLEFGKIPAGLLKEVQEKVFLRYNVRKSDFPLLALCGRSDPIVPAAASVEWGRSAPQSQQVVVLDGVGHEVSPRMVELVINFIRRFS